METISKRHKTHSKKSSKTKQKFPKSGTWHHLNGPAPRWLMHQNDILVNNYLIGDIKKPRKMCYAFAAISCLNYFSLKQNRIPIFTVEDFAIYAGHGLDTGGSPFKSMKDLTISQSKLCYAGTLQQPNNEVLKFLNCNQGSLGLFREKPHSRHPGHIVIIGRFGNYWLKLDVWYGSVSIWTPARGGQSITAGSITEGQAYHKIINVPD